MASDQERWTAVDAYVVDTLVGSDAALDDAIATSAAAGLPPIAVSPSQGQFLLILAKAMAARRILELGTLGGYSGIWLARALPTGGCLVTVDIDEQHAAVARRNFERAGLMDRIDLRVGAALDVLAQLEAERESPFDFVFIDADKVNYAAYLDRVVRLSRPGTLIVADNVVRDGAVIDAASTDVAVQGVRRFMDDAAAHPRLTATTLQTVGSKGYDGMAIVFVDH